jgi:hypothetical protein
MRLLKTHVLLRFVNSYLVDSPQPANISYLWNFGSLLGACLIIQILTGAFLAMHYTPNVDFAFNSVEHIMRDVNNGWLIRYTHANVASFFFIFVYMHIGRGLYYSSYKSPRVLVWSIGVIMLVLMMAIGFLGYLLSPKWFNIDISYHFLFFLCLLPCKARLLFFYRFILFLPNKELVNTKRNRNVIKNISSLSLPLPSPLEKGGMVANRGTNIKLKRGYSTSASNLAKISERLILIIQELGVNPIYLFENLNLDGTLKKIQNDRR